MLIRKIATSTVIAASLTLLILVGALSAREKENKTDPGIGERFHQETSFTWAGALAGVFRPKPPMPPQYKTYPSAEKLELPKPKFKGLTVEEAIKKRRSIRNYSKQPITKDQLSQLLFAAQGLTGKMFGKRPRSAPSAGALYPFEIYAVVNNVQDLPKGIYHYAVQDHALERVKTGDFRSKITDAGLEQEMLGEAAVTFVLSAIFDRVCHKYGERGYRYVYMEAGHISQNIYLQAVSSGLGSVCAGAFSDEKVNRLIDVDGRKEAAIYLHAVGAL
jgi:SagB-type dehydrogenase family enzyme